MLEAVEQGLGTVWICYFKPAKDRISVKELVEYLYNYPKPKSEPAAKTIPVLSPALFM